MIDFTAFSHGQVASKQWLCETLEPIVKEKYSVPVKIAVLGGWYGILPFMLFVRNNINIESITSYDIDGNANMTADKINNCWMFDNWKFKAYYGDANKVDLSNFDIVINTSSEHIVDRNWFNTITNQLLVIQGTDQIHDDNDPHDYVFSLEQLHDNYPVKLLYKGVKNFVYPDKEFTRYMIIGVKQPSQL